MANPVSVVPEEHLIETLKKRGNDFFVKNEHEKAIGAYTEGILLDPSAHLLFSNRAAAYLRLKNYDEAINDANECIRLSPTFVKGHIRLAQALFSQQCYVEAEEAVLKIEILEPNNKSIKTLRESIGSKKMFSLLEGPWYGTVNDEAGGYLQIFNFMGETVAQVCVFGRTMMATMKLRSGVNGEPGFLDIHLPSEEGQQQMPEILHIFKLENNNNELHLCSPYMTPVDVRPTKFEGPAYMVMYRGTPPVDEKVQAETFPTSPIAFSNSLWLLF